MTTVFGEIVGIAMMCAVMLVVGGAIIVAIALTSVVLNGVLTEIAIETVATIVVTTVSEIAMIVREGLIANAVIVPAMKDLIVRVTSLIVIAPLLRLLRLVIDLIRSVLVPTLSILVRSGRRIARLAS